MTGTRVRARYKCRWARSLWALCVAVLGCLSVTPAAVAAADCDPWVAQAASIQGKVERRLAGQRQWLAVKRNDVFCEGDAVRVRANSRAALILNNSSLLRLDQDTTITFTGLQADQPAWLDLVEGVAHFISRVRQSFKVITPFVNAAVEGTEFVVRVRGQATEVTVFEGQVAMRNARGEEVLTSGQAALAAASQAPVRQTIVRPRDAVQWALYYPVIIDFDASKFAELPEQWRQPVQRSLQAYQAGDVTAALEQIEQLPAGQPELFEVYVYRASLRLSVGRVEAARADLDSAWAARPGDSNVLALRSIIAVVQNQSAEALKLAKEAVAADTRNPAAALALSYAQQAHFDLSGALASLQTAVAAAPDNALAWARLAELRLSVGDLEQGLEAAEEANNLEPRVALTWTIRGFANLTQIRIAEAVAAFEQAVELDQAAPLPRLGLGLAKIRKGKLAAGRAEIEIAVALAPGNSLMRSYMGKAYYEEKRDRLAANQYEMAKELDPNDPTPWFYDAIRKQTENRPVEALHDMQTSIALNDNRAVFRSRLQLDEDLASRSASIARVYRDLGFEQRALVEGWNAVNTDPANFSAHRLLADSYASLPRHQIARVSELLQSQLLQPINLTPVQPQLAETNLFILEGAGPSDPAFMEFNSLFTRNRLALQANALYGGNDTWGDDLIHNGVYNNWSWSLGQFHYESDGFRDNNDQEQDIYNLFVQGALSHRTSVQAELRHQEIDSGDLVQRFEPDDFLDTERRDTKVETARLGLHHAFNPRSEVIASFIYLHDSDEDVDTKVPQDLGPLGTLETVVDLDTDNDGYTAEVQHHYRGRSFKLVSGVGYFSGEKQAEIIADSTLTPPSPFVPPTRVVSERDEDLDHWNAYAYGHIPFGNTVTVTVGSSYDDVELDETEQETFTVDLGPPIGSVTTVTSDKNRSDLSKLNPKFGITWQVASNTVLRAAGFRTIARDVVGSQTVEPTQVAGFNQFYDDPAGTKAVRYGLAADHMFNPDLAAGLEYAWRDTEVPFEGVADEIEWDERFGRAYLYWTPLLRIAASAEYQYERFKREDAFTGEFQATRVRTHKLPLTLNYFHPRGWIGRIRTTYVNQEGDFTTAGPGFLPGVSTEDKNDTFWLVDASLGYRLPRRRGLVSLGVANLFDEDFKFVDTDPFNPRVYPERFVFGRITLSF